MGLSRVRKIAKEVKVKNVLFNRPEILKQHKKERNKANGVWATANFTVAVHIEPRTYFVRTTLRGKYTPQASPNGS